MDLEKKSERPFTKSSMRTDKEPESLSVEPFELEFPIVPMPAKPPRPPVRPPSELSASTEID